MLKTLSFFSNFLNHHQLPFCEAMVKKIGDGFKFVATEPVHSDRLAMGYEDMNTKYPFVVRSYENEASYAYAMQLAYECDLVITGAAPENFIHERLAANKITFRYSERFFKKGIWRIVDPRVIRSLYLNHFRFRHKHLYMLCASAYTARDFSFVNCYRNKTYKWGYFPKIIKYDLEDLNNKRKNNNKVIILWVGRLLKLKHPEKAIFVARHLDRENIKFELQIIGEGEQESRIRTLIKKYNLADKVKLFGFQSPGKVRDFMEKANIYLFTSNKQEGWGAVLNEAMNSGCAVVSSNAIGSVPFLIENGQNGFVYKNDSLEDLNNKVSELCKNEFLRNSLGLNAYRTISEVWNAEKAAENLMKLYSTIISGANNNIVNGPCSEARPILN